MIRRFSLAFVGLVLAISLSQPAIAGRVECGAVRSALMKRPVRYCALLPPSYDAEKTRRYPVLYYLHGLFENEQTFVDFGGWNLVESAQDSKRIGEYLIVIPDGGRSFYINARDGNQPYENFLIREFLPAIEKKFRILAGRQSRGIAGTSMGGYGALRLAVKHPQLFVSVSAHSAALIEQLPRALPEGVPQRFQRRLEILGEVYGSPPDRTFWDANNVFTYARQAGATALRRLKIYFDCGNTDEYGFDAGATALHKLLDTRKIPHEFHLYPGGHGPLYLAEHLDASLEFHSRAFGLTK